MAKRKKTRVAKAKTTGKAKTEKTQAREGDDAFVRGVVTRGEAAKAVKGKLPPGATHEIVEERDGELPKIARRRFSAS